MEKRQNGCSDAKVDMRIGRKIRSAPGDYSAKRRPSILMRCVVGAGCVLIAFTIRYFLTPLLGEELPFMLFIAAVLVAAWYGGAITGFAALLLGLLLADWFFIPPKSVLGTSNFLEVFRIVRYLFTASVGIALIEILHRGRRRTQAAV